VWKRDIQAEYGQFGLNHGYASTPLLHGNRLYVQVLHGMKTDDPSYVFAADKNTGKTLWKVERPTGCMTESPDNYATPQLVSVGGKLQLVISAAITRRATIWTRKGAVASGWIQSHEQPNEPHHRFFACIGGKRFHTEHSGTAIHCVPCRRLRQYHRQERTLDQQPRSGCANSDDRREVYLRSEGQWSLNCLEAATGKAIYESQRIELGTYSSSPLLADGKIYCVNEEGTTTVVKAGPAFEILGVSKLDSPTLASPVAVGNQLFIRTADHLIASKSESVLPVITTEWIRGWNVEARNRAATYQFKLDNPSRDRRTPPTFVR
jgi:outer membrane protein assembly factor BamB